MVDRLSDSETIKKAKELPELAKLFLKLGIIGFGGPAVHIALMEEEVVQKRKWMSQQHFLDLVGATNLIPGPNSTEMTMHIGKERFTPGPVFSSASFIGWQIGGASGAIAATIGIFLPSFLFVALLNPLIPRLRKSKTMSAFLDTVNVVSIAIILSVVVEIGRVTLVDWRSLVVAVSALRLHFISRS